MRIADLEALPIVGEPEPPMQPVGGSCRSRSGTDPPVTVHVRLAAGGLTRPGRRNGTPICPRGGGRMVPSGKDGRGGDRPKGRLPWLHAGPRFRSARNRAALLRHGVFADLRRWTEAGCSIGGRVPQTDIRRVGWREAYILPRAEAGLLGRMKRGSSQIITPLASAEAELQSDRAALLRLRSDRGCGRVGCEQFCSDSGRTKA